MPGPQPKAPGQKRRRNVESTARTLLPFDRAKLPVPQLPAGIWHPAAVAFWNDLWASPMAPEYDESDLHGLYLLADLVNEYWSVVPDRGATTRKKDLAAEIRLQRQCFGLSPMDRRRLQWTIEQADAAQDAGSRRRGGQVGRSGGADDPRLREVIDVEAVDEAI